MLTLLILLKLLKLLHRFGAKGRIYTCNMVVPYTLTFCSEGHNAYGGLLSKKSECLVDWVGHVGDNPSTATITRTPAMLKINPTSALQGMNLTEGNWEDVFNLTTFVYPECGVYPDLARVQVGQRP